MLKIILWPLTFLKKFWQIRKINSVCSGRCLESLDAIEKFGKIFLTFNFSENKKLEFARNSPDKIPLPYDQDDYATEVFENKPKILGFKFRDFIFHNRYGMQDYYDGKVIFTLEHIAKNGGQLNWTNINL